MKTQTLIACFILACAATLSAQQASLGVRIGILTMNKLTLPYRPGETPETVKLNAFSSDILGMFPQKGGKILRLRLGYLGVAVDDDRQGDGDGTYSKYVLSQSNFSFAPGLATTITQSDMFRLYAGADLPLTAIGGLKGKTTGVRRVEDPQTMEYKNESYEYSGTINGGMSIGIAPVLGFRVKAFGPLDFGVEVSSGLQYMHTGGDITSYENGQKQVNDTDQYGFSSFSRTPVRMNMVLAFNLSAKKQ